MIFFCPRYVSNILAAREKGPHKLNSGNKYGGSEVFQLLRPPFSLEPVTLVAEKQDNSVFKNIPHLFGSKLEPMRWNRCVRTDALEPTRWNRCVGTDALEPMR